MEPETESSRLPVLGNGEIAQMVVNELIIGAFFKNPEGDWQNGLEKVLREMETTDHRQALVTRALYLGDIKAFIILRDHYQLNDQIEPEEVCVDPRIFETTHRVIIDTPGLQKSLIDTLTRFLQLSKEARDNYLGEILDSCVGEILSGHPDSYQSR